MAGRGFGAWPGGAAARRASAFPLVFLSLLLATRVSDVLLERQDGQVAFTVVLFVLPIMYAFPGGRRVLTRYRWPVLAVQAVLTWVPFAVFGGAWQVGVGGLLVGSVLLLVPGRWRYAGFTAVIVSWAVLSTAVPLRGLGAFHGVFAVLFFAAGNAGVGLAVYGLASLARQMEALQDELARVAVVQERLRIARDVHDLLGLGLSAIALKADLTGALIGRDHAAARAEIAEMTRICAAARADIRQVTSDGQRLSLAAELTVARQILTSAGLLVQADIPAGPLPPAAEDVLATVLREAVTNILRHSSAATCTIQLSIGAGAVRLQVGNDGVPPRPAGSGGSGRGLANLSARLQAVSGFLSSRQAEGRFDLLAQIPLAAPSR